MTWRRAAAKTNQRSPVTVRSFDDPFSDHLINSQLTTAMVRVAIVPGSTSALQ